MSRYYSRLRAELFDRASAEAANEYHIELREIAASKLCHFTRHLAGGGSEYVSVGDLEIRFADHSNWSVYRDRPDYNIIHRYLNEKEIEDIRSRVDYPELLKKTVLALAVGLTVPKLKKLLSPDCYESVVLDDNYPNTKYELVRVQEALATLKKEGIAPKFPVAQEIWSEEDYAGNLF